MESTTSLASWDNNSTQQNQSAYEKNIFFTRLNGLLALREFMEKASDTIVSDHASSIPDQRNHNIIFMILQLLFTFPLSIILIALIYSIYKKNLQILSNLNSLTMTDIKQVEKKYRRYFSFRSKHLLTQGKNFYL